MTELYATAVGAEEMDDAYVLVIAEHPDGSGRRFEFQSSPSNDEQEKSLGMDTYCLCTETGARHYAGVTSWMLGEDAVLVVALDDAASNTLGVAGGFRVTVPHRDLSLLRESLQRILGAELEKRPA